MRNYAREMYGNSLSDWGEGFVNFWHNLFNSWSGKDMTEAQLQQIDVNRQDATTAFNRQLYMDSSKYQCTVADMQAAGINPMLAAGGSVSSPSVQLSNSASAQQGTMNLGSLLQAAMMPAQLSQINAQTKVARAQAKNIEADTANKEADTAGKLWLNDFNKRTEDAQAEGIAKKNALTDSQISSINQGINESKSRISLMLKQEKSEDEKQRLMISEQLLNNVTAQNITEVQPFIKAAYAAETNLKNASTKKEIELAKLTAIDAAYRQKLIDTGAIEAAVRLDNASASEAEVKAAVAEVERKLEKVKLARQTGNWSEVLSDGDGQRADEKVVNALFSGLHGLASSVLGK